MHVVETERIRRLLGDGFRAPVRVGVVPTDSIEIFVRIPGPESSRRAGTAGVLPLRFGRENQVGPSAERDGVVPRHSDDGLVRLIELTVVPLLGWFCLRVCLQEPFVLSVSHRGSSESERSERHFVLWAFVRVATIFVVGRPHQKCPARNQHHLAAGLLFDD